MAKLRFKILAFNWKCLLPILCLILVNGIIGILSIRDYGQSWDEPYIFHYADVALSAYADWWRGEEIPDFEIESNYGPAYVMGVNLVTRLLDRFFLNWSDVHIRHLIGFIIFQIGIYVFYRLCNRWMGTWAAFGATVLLATQPIFWGHSFFNPKDMPFMSFFIFSIYFGIKAYDSIFRKNNSGRSAFGEFVNQWLKTSIQARRRILIITILWAISIVLLIGMMPLWRTMILSCVATEYEASQYLLVDRLFAGAVSNVDGISLGSNIQSCLASFNRAHLLYLIISPILMLVLWLRPFPQSFKSIICPVVLAGIILGLTSSIRVGGPFAGAMVCLYFLAKVGKRAIPLLGIYIGTAFFIAYITWPYLWEDFIGNFSESLSVMARFPFIGQVLFNSEYYASTEIPHSYLPVLMAIQFTEPVLILFAIGVGSLVLSAFKGRPKLGLLGISALWLFSPLIGFILFRAPFYDNFRQIFFILPPVFMVAGYELHKIFSRIDRPAIKVIIILITISPGIFHIVQLHPYEYIYYNSLIGGVEGAYRRFELDYWGLSYREVGNYLNENAPPNANVWISAPIHLIKLRDDINVFYDLKDERAEYYDYVVATTRYNHDLTTYPGAEIVHTIERSGAILSVIKGSTKGL